MITSKLVGSSAQQKNIVIGIDLGNTLTTICYDDKYFHYQTVLSINLLSKSITIGHEPQTIHQRLQQKQQSLKKHFLTQQQQSQRSLLQKQNIVVLDLLELFIKSLKKNSNSNQKDKLQMLENRLPECFGYYALEFEENQMQGFQIIIDSGRKRLIKKDQLVVVRNVQRKIDNNTHNLSKYEDEIVQRILKNTITLDQCLSLYITSILSTIKTQPLTPNTKHQLIFNYYGFQPNSYLTSLSNIKSIFTSCTVSFVTNTTSLALYYYAQYLTKVRNNYLERSTRVACLDFGSRGCAFSVVKLYGHQSNVMQVQEYFVNDFGGAEMTRILIDIIVENVKIYKGVNIRSTPEMVQQLYRLAEQTKLAFSSAQQVYVRIQGYPLPQPYGFPLQRRFYQQKLSQRLLPMLNSIKAILSEYSFSGFSDEKTNPKPKHNISTMIINGQCCHLPAFKKWLDYLVRNRAQGKDQQNVEIVRADRNWISKGNFLWRESGVVVLQKAVKGITVRGDQEYEEVIAEKGKQLPVRLVKELPMPRAQLTYTLRFYQDDFEICKYLIESKNLQWEEKLNFIAQKQQSKPLTVYSTKYLGHMHMKGSSLCKPVVINQKFSLKLFNKKWTNQTVFGFLKTFFLQKT